MYKVIHMFRDLADNGNIYQPGDEFPRAGLDVSDERLIQLSSCDNARGKPLIQAVEAPVHAEEAEEKPKPTRKRVKKDDD